MHTHPFTGPLSGTTQLSRYQKGKPIWILLKQETVSGSGISWAICKSAPHCRQITTPVPHRSVFYRLDALSATQPTVSMYWRTKLLITTEFYSSTTKVNAIKWAQLSENNQVSKTFVVHIVVWKLLLNEYVTGEHYPGEHNPWILAHGAPCPSNPTTLSSLNI